MYMVNKDYDKAVSKINAANEKHIALFKKWLKSNGLTDKTIKNHLSNVDFYISDFLNYYEPQTMEAGCYKIDQFLGDFFRRKAMWASSAQIKANAASIKKFYKCMLEYELVTEEAFLNLCIDIKEGLQEWLDAMWLEEQEEYDFF
jgi:5-hydroxyisourate hydrolase-like protein (transthyretin family)